MCNVYKMYNIIYVDDIIGIGITNYKQANYLCGSKNL